MTEKFIPFGTASFFAPNLLTETQTVHIVDDLGESLRFVAGALEKSGYRVAITGDLREFADALDPKRVRAVFLDVHLGTDDATDVIDFLKERSVTTDVYLVSGDPRSIDCAKRYAEERGVRIAGTLQKPFTGSRLVELLEPPVETLEEIVRDIDIEDGFRKGWIYPVLQPKLDLASGRIRSAELLTRIAHPSFGVISAQDFVGRISIEQSHKLFLEQLSFVRRHFAFDPRKGNDFRININIDSANLVRMSEDLGSKGREDPDFFRNMIFEITEESVVKLSDEHLKALYKLHLCGARFSIDDFGIGHSNFSRISRLPIHEIKLDRTLIHGCSALQKRQLIIKTLVTMAHDLDAKVVAEGVENCDDLAWLKDANCDEAQGFMIGRPMKLDRFKEFMKTQQ